MLARIQVGLKPKIIDSFGEQTKKRILTAANGLRSWKQFAEPWIDRLPVRLAHLACKGLGLSYTIAFKGE